jgi:hypothetical protein
MKPVSSRATATTTFAAGLCSAVSRRKRRQSRCERRGCGDGDAGASEGDVWAEEAPGLAGLAAGRCRAPLGFDRGARARRPLPEARRGRPRCQVSNRDPRGPSIRLSRFHWAIVREEIILQNLLCGKRALDGER